VQISGTLQRIGKNEGPKKPMLLSIRVVRIELLITAMYLYYLNLKNSVIFISYLQFCQSCDSGKKAQV